MNITAVNTSCPLQLSIILILSQTLAKIHLRYNCGWKLLQGNHSYYILSASSPHREAKIIRLNLSCIVLPHFSRNPYERLVSAYKDKVLGEGGRYIQKGNPCPRQMLNMPPAPALTFKQFVTCIIRRSKEKTDNLSHFESGSNLDMHWKPQTLLCNFCTTDFNIIGHAEHMTQDTHMTLQLLAMKNMTLLQCNKSTAGRLNYTSTGDWYRTLGRELLEEFHQLYYHDFTLLGYNMTLA